MLMLALMIAMAPPAVSAGDRSRYVACLALARSEPSRAIESAQAWRIENGGMAALHCLALAQFERKDYAAAFTSFDSAVRASQTAGDGQVDVLRAQAADAAMLAGQPEAAVRFLDAALAGAGTNLSPRVAATLLVTRAEAFVELKRETEAAADLDRALRLEPKVSDGALLQATLARRMGNLSLAETAILRAAEQTPDSAEVQYEAGNIAAAKGDMLMAKTAWTAAAATDPGSIAGVAAAKALKAATATPQGGS